EGGDAHHVEAAGHVGVLVDVELDDLELAGLLLGDLLEDRGDRLARSAPLSPEVDQDGLGRAADLLVEGGVGDALHGVSSFRSGDTRAYGLVQPARGDRHSPPRLLTFGPTGR